MTPDAVAALRQRIRRQHDQTLGQRLDALKADLASWRVAGALLHGRILALEDEIRARSVATGGEKGPSTVD